MPTHVVKVAGSMGKGVLVTDSPTEAAGYVARVLGSQDDLVVEVTLAGPPTRGGNHGRPACEWCRRPGHTVFITTRTGEAGDPTGTVTMHHPVLCRICQGLLCWTGEDGPEALQDAQEAVIAELCASWRLRSDNEALEDE